MLSPPASVLKPLCRGVLLLYVAGVTLDFGGVLDRLQPVLALVPCILVLVFYSAPVRTERQTIPVHGLLWIVMGGVMLLVAILQLLPLPEALGSFLSPAAATIHRNADEVARALDPAADDAGWFPLSVMPDLTRIQLMRIFAAIATFLLAAALFAGRRSRLQLAFSLALLAGFEIVYGYRQWTGDQRTIWGWENEAGIHRVSGTFVNANHYAHFLAICLPVVLYAVFAAWWRAKRSGGGTAETTASFFDQHAWVALPAAAAALAIVIGIILSASRGAAASLLVATIVVTITRASLASSSSRRGAHHRRWAGPAALLVLVILGTGLVALALRQDVITSRFARPGALDVAGRTGGWTTAARVIGLFPISGSGLGTFPAVAASVQDPELEKLFTRAHNDYLELLATGGVMPGTIVIVLALAGWAALLVASVRIPREVRDRLGVSSDRQLFIACVSVSLAVALLHALIDFNSQIPANVILWALLAGAASAPVSALRAGDT